MGCPARSDSVRAAGPGWGGGHRGGDRDGNSALWRIVITRMATQPATRAYVECRTKEGMSTPEIIRCLKRYVAREVFTALPREALT